jgi:hypothetical protein
MTIQQTILAFVPLIVLVFLIVVMARMVKVQPERRETLRNMRKVYFRRAAEFIDLP